MNEQQYKPAWRSFYWHFVAIAALLAAAGTVSLKWIPEGGQWQQWLWRVTAAAVICLVISLLCKRSSHALLVKSDKVSLESGLIARQSVEVNMRSIRSIQIRQSVIQRMLNVGDIMVVSAGDEYEIVAANMPNPHEIREAIHSASSADNGAKEKAE